MLMDTKTLILAVLLGISVVVNVMQLKNDGELRDLARMACQAHMGDAGVCARKALD